MVYPTLTGKRYDVDAQACSVHPCGFHLWRTRSGVQRVTYYVARGTRRSTATHSAPGEDSPDFFGTLSNRREASSSRVSQGI